MSRLHNGETFPSLSFPAVGGGTIALPDDVAGSYGVVLIYRGSWCPYCNAQLASFSRATDALNEVGAKVVCSMPLDGKTYDVNIAVDAIDSSTKSAHYSVQVADKPRN